MTGKERIGVALAGLGKTGYTVDLPERIEGIPASRQDFMDIRLMTDVKENAVLYRVIYAVERNGKLNTAEIRREMSARARYVFHQKFADFPAQLGNVPFGNGAEVGIAVYII